MKKRYFWALWRSEDGLFVSSFRSNQDRQDFLAGCLKTPGIKVSYGIVASHPEVRRLQRRLAQGEQIMFPHKIED